MASGTGAGTDGEVSEGDSAIGEIRWTLVGLMGLLFDSGGDGVRAACLPEPLYWRGCLRRLDTDLRSVVRPCPAGTVLEFQYVQT